MIFFRFISFYFNQLNFFFILFQQITIIIFFKRNFSITTSRALISITQTIKTNKLRTIVFSQRKLLKTKLTSLIFNFFFKKNRNKATTSFASWLQKALLRMFITNPMILGKVNKKTLIFFTKQTV